jgi:hypothetical protein
VSIYKIEGGKKYINIIPHGIVPTESHKSSAAGGSPTTVVLCVLNI